MDKRCNQRRARSLVTGAASVKRPAGQDKRRRRARVIAGSAADTQASDPGAGPAFKGAASPTTRNSNPLKSANLGTFPAMSSDRGRLVA